MKDAKVSTLYENYLEECQRKLKTIGCCQENWEKLAITGLNGWVFENLVTYLIKQDSPSVSIKPQQPLYQKGLKKRVKVDMLINEKIAIEAKVAGVYSKEYINRLGEYKKAAEEKGWVYLYISRQESYEPYYKGTKEAVGPQNAFFLDRQKGDWNRFIKRISQLLKAPAFAHA